MLYVNWRFSEHLDPVTGRPTRCEGIPMLVYPTGGLTFPLDPQTVSLRSFS
jgi:hypothetical protein